MNIIAFSDEAVNVFACRNTLTKGVLGQAVALVVGLWTGRRQLLLVRNEADDRIERRWWEVHANVTRNHRCGTMPALIAQLRWYLAAKARRRRGPPSETIPIRRVA